MKKTQPWHAVTITSRSDSCAAADSCRGKRFLSGAAPLLPLPECDRPKSCACIYRHYDDRRGKLRRADDGGPTIGLPKPVMEKRTSRGRRSTD